MSPTYAHDDPIELVSRENVTQRIRLLLDRPAALSSITPLSADAEPVRRQSEFAQLLGGDGGVTPSESAAPPELTASSDLQPPKEVSKAPTLTEPPGDEIATSSAAQIPERSFANAFPLDGQSASKLDLSEYSFPLQKLITEGRTPDKDTTITFSASPIELVNIQAPAQGKHTQPLSTSAYSLFDECDEQARAQDNRCRSRLAQEDNVPLSDRTSQYLEPIDTQCYRKLKRAHSVPVSTSHWRSNAFIPVPRPAGEPEVENSPHACTDSACKRFEIYIRECTGLTSHNADVSIENEAPIAGTEGHSIGNGRLVAQSVGSAANQPKHRGGGRSWRWWKLVSNERNSSPTQSDADAASTEPTESCQEPEGVERREGEPCVSNPTKKNHKKSHSRSSNRTAHVAEASSGSRASDQAVRCQQLPHLTQEEIEPMERSTPRSKNAIRFHDAFGNSVLVDDEEITARPSNAPNRQSTGSSTPSRQRRSRSQRLRLFSRHQTGRSTDSSQIPREAILPIVQNDGSRSVRQEWSRVYRVCASKPPGLRAVANNEKDRKKINDSNRLDQQKASREDGDTSVAFIVTVAAVATEQQDKRSQSTNVSCTVEVGSRRFMRIEFLHRGPVTTTGQ